MPASAERWAPRRHEHTDGRGRRHARLHPHRRHRRTGAHRRLGNRCFPGGGPGRSGTAHLKVELPDSPCRGHRLGREPCFLHCPQRTARSRGARLSEKRPDGTGGICSAEGEFRALLRGPPHPGQGRRAASRRPHQPGPATTGSRGTGRRTGTRPGGTEEVSRESRHPSRPDHAGSERPA